jgi:hypothetical protein
MTDNNSSNKSKTIIIIAIVVVAIVLTTAAYLLLSSDSTLEPAITPDPEISATSQPASGTITFQSYFVEPERINAGECVVLSWAVENADQIVLRRDGSSVVGNAQSSDTFQDCLNQAGIVVYRLEASNSAGESNWMELQVIVQ